MEKVDVLIKQKKALLKNTEDVYESEKLFSELDGLEWLQAQIVIFNLDNNEAIGM